MFDNSNPYSLHFEEHDGRRIYFVSFTDGQSLEQSVEVSHTVYEEFVLFIKHERNLRRSDERHMIRLQLSEEELYKRAFNPPKSLEDSACEKQRDKLLWQAIHKLPKIQKRRFLLYYETGLTYEQVARIEGCRWQPVSRSIERAKEKIVKFLKI